MPPEEQKPEEPAAITMDTVNDAINQAFNNRLKRFKTDMLSEMNIAVTKALEPISQKLTETPAEPAKGEDGKMKLPLEVENRIKQLETTANNAVKTANEEKTKREETEKRVLRQEEREALSKAYKAGGVVDAYIPTLVDAQMARGVVIRDDEGNISWRKNKDEVTGLDDGVKEYLSSPEGKHYLPATGARGAGNAASSKNGAPAGKPEQVTEGEITQFLLG